MAMDDLQNTTGSVTRTFRTAMRIGEDFFTLEESIVLPLDASNEEIAQAVALGWRIYHAQREALESQAALVREAYAARAPGGSATAVRDPDAPASEKQRNYISLLQNDLVWSNEQLSSYADEQGIDLVRLTRGQASSFIDGLKKVAEERGAYRAGTGDEGAAMTARQQQALQRLAHERGAALEAEVQQRFGVAVSELTNRQAGELIMEWQGQRSGGG